MRQISAKAVTEAVRAMCIEANRVMPEDVQASLAANKDLEEAPAAEEKAAE